MNKLVIFDINGVICCRKRIDINKQTILSVSKRNNTDIIVSNYDSVSIDSKKPRIIFLRKGIIDLIQNILNYCDVAIMSTSSERCFGPMMNLLESKLQRPFRFVKYNCVNKQIDDCHAIIDDSIDKVSMNKNYFVPPSYRGYDDEDDEKLNDIFSYIIDFTKHD